ncbi:hypothetical protein [Streptomyces violaceus]|uniref:Uncharacterized protein n=1 Tax=Streptomyces violaceus TaxID=1936 RepID=A0ABZ1NL62_STRVL
MSRYLEEAAALLREAADANAKGYNFAATKVELAREFAMLAAVDKGLLPAEITQDVIAAVVARTTA